MLVGGKGSRGLSCSLESSSKDDTISQNRKEANAWAVIATYVRYWNG